MAYRYKMPGKRPNKYGNKKTEFDGQTFDSKKELSRYKTLKAMLEIGVISELRRQQKFVLIPSQRIEGKLIEREASYIADFVYVDNETGRTIVEDTKGFRTDTYILKRKMMLWKYGIRIKEI